MILLEDVINRKAILEKELDETLSKANALNGAIQDCNFWIEQLNKEENQEKENSVQEVPTN